MVNQIFWQSGTVAVYLNVSTQTLTNWRYRKIGPAYIKPSRNSVLYDPEEVRIFLEKREVIRGRMPRPISGRLPK